MNIYMKCKGLVATYTSNTEMLRCVEPFSFYYVDEIGVTITIKEECKREVIIECETEAKGIYLYSLLTKLERLLHILDGAFVALEDISFWGKEDDNSYRSLLMHVKTQRLRYFVPSNIITVKNDRLIYYEEVLSGDLLHAWQILIDELDVANQMYLYSTCESGFTNDVKCAFLIELSETMLEIIGKDNITLHKLSSERNDDLKVCLRTIILEYGQVLFNAEIHYDLEKILKCLVNTRVNIMHIKIHQRTPKFDGPEATLYMIKMSYLYRLVIMNKLRIDENIYIERLIHRVNRLNEWNGIQNGLFQRLGIDS